MDVLGKDLDDERRVNVRKIVQVRMRRKKVPWETKIGKMPSD